MELRQEAALYPEMWIYIVQFSKSFKLLNSPTWICLSAYQCVNKHCGVMGECCIRLSQCCLQSLCAYSSHRIVFCYRNLD